MRAAPAAQRPRVRPSGRRTANRRARRRCSRSPLRARKRSHHPSAVRLEFSGAAQIRARVCIRSREKKTRGGRRAHKTQQLVKAVECVKSFENSLLVGELASAPGTQRARTVRSEARGAAVEAWHQGQHKRRRRVDRAAVRSRCGDARCRVRGRATRRRRRVRGRQRRADQRSRASLSPVFSGCRRALHLVTVIISQDARRPSQDGEPSQDSL